MSIKTFEAQKNWEQLLINCPHQAIVDFVGTPDFDLIKNNPTTANLFIRHGRAEKFEQIFFSFPQHVLNNSFLAFQLVDSNSIDLEKKIYLDYFAPFFEDVLFAEKAVNTNSDVYQYLPEKSKLDFYIAHAALKKNGKNFKHLPESLKNIDELKVIACDNKYYSGYQFLSLQDQNKEVYYQLAKKDLSNYEFFSDFLKKKFKNLLLQKPSLLEFAPDALLNNENFVRSVLALEPSSLKWAPEKYQKDKDYCLELYTKNVNAILGFHGDILKDKDFCLKLFSNTAKHNIPLTWNIIPEEFQTDDEFLRSTIRKNSKFFLVASDKILKDNIFISSVQSNQAETFKNIPDKIKNNNIKLMMDLSLVITQQRIKKNVKFQTLKTKDFINEFKIDEPIQSYLLKQVFNNFKSLYTELSKILLEKKLEIGLEIKIENKQKIKI